MTQFEVRVAGRDEFPSKLRLLIAGAPGVGKTQLAAAFPNPIFANSAGGLTTLSQIGNVPYVTVESERDLHNLKLALDKEPDERAELFGRQIDTLVIDSIDEFQRMMMLSRLAKMNRQDTLPEDWGWIANRLHKIFTGLNQLDIHLVILSRTKDVPVSSDFTAIKPAIGGGFCDGIHKYTHTSFLMKASTELEVHWQANNQEPVLEDPNVKRFLLASPQRDAEWCHDKTGKLPVLVDASSPDYVVELLASSIIDAQDDVPESDSFTVDLTEKTDVKEEAEGSQPISGQLNIAEEIEYVCTNCNKVFTERAWADLSNTRAGATLCSACFKEKDK